MMAGEHFYRPGSYPCDEPILYEGAGLDGIYLCNGYDRDEVDGEWFTWIEDIEGLHHAIALHLVLNRKALAPKEIRFIRNTMDKTQAEIAHMIRVDEQTVARWEKGKTAMPGSADTLLRSKFLASIGTAEELREFVSERSDKLDELDGVGEITFVRDPESDEWKDASEKVLEGAD
jgi:transcriptional regulator with XRE-family HTH domain